MGLLGGAAADAVEGQDAFAIGVVEEDARLIGGRLQVLHHVQRVVGVLVRLAFEHDAGQVAAGPDPVVPGQRFSI